MENTAIRKPARAMLAAIALATDVPVPREVAFYAERAAIALTFSSVGDGILWAQRLGFNADTYINPGDGFRYLSMGIGDWHGWHVSLHAHDEPPFDEIDSDHTAALTALVEHSEIGTTGQYLAAAR